MITTDTTGDVVRNRVSLAATNLAELTSARLAENPSAPEDRSSCWRRRTAGWCT